MKEYDPCANNGIMKHLERLKKIVNWAVIDKDGPTGKFFSDETIPATAEISW